MNRRNNINDEELRKMQMILLNILKTIDKVCTEHNLTYYMIAGTMLGAIRHKGFIPWDDDADIAMPRADYDIFIQHANKWLPPYYELISGDKDKEYPYAFARVQDTHTTYILRRNFNYIGGLPVDVFPLDGMTDDTIAKKWHYIKYKSFRQLMYYNLRNPYKHGHGPESWIIRTIHKIVSKKWIHQKMDNIQKDYDYDNHKLVADHDNAPARGILPKEIYGTPVRYKFEDTMLCGVAQPHKYLEYCYGDYMKQPDKLPLPNFRLLNLDKPYKDFIKKNPDIFKS